jgi:hypothetical protein
MSSLRATAKLTALRAAIRAADAAPGFGKHPVTRFDGRRRRDGKVVGGRKPGRKG